VHSRSPRASWRMRGVEESWLPHTFRTVTADPSMRESPRKLAGTGVKEEASQWTERQAIRSPTRNPDHHAEGPPAWRAGPPSRRSSPQPPYSFVAPHLTARSMPLGGRFEAAKLPRSVGRTGQREIGKSEQGRAKIPATTQSGPIPLGHLEGGQRRGLWVSERWPGPLSWVSIDPRTVSTQHRGPRLLGPAPGQADSPPGSTASPHQFGLNISQWQAATLQAGRGKSHWSCPLVVVGHQKPPSSGFKATLELEQPPRDPAAGREFPCPAAPAHGTLNRERSPLAARRQLGLGKSEAALATRPSADRCGASPWARPSTRESVEGKPASATHLVALGGCRPARNLPLSRRSSTPVCGNQFAVRGRARHRKLAWRCRVPGLAMRRGAASRGADVAVSDRPDQVSLRRERTATLGIGAT